MARAFNTPRCRNLRFSMAEAQRLFVRSGGCPFFSWGAAWQRRWRERRVGVAQARRASTFIIGIDGGGKDDLAGVTILEARSVPQGEVIQFFGIQSIEGSSE